MISRWTWGDNFREFIRWYPLGDFWEFQRLRLNFCIKICTWHWQFLHTSLYRVQIFNLLISTCKLISPLWELRHACKYSASLQIPEVLAYKYVMKPIAWINVLTVMYLTKFGEHLILLCLHWYAWDKRHVCTFFLNDMCYN